MTLYNIWLYICKKKSISGYYVAEMKKCGKPCFLLHWLYLLIKCVVPTLKDFSWCICFADMGILSDINIHPFINVDITDQLLISERKGLSKPLATTVFLIFILDKSESKIGRNYIISIIFYMFVTHVWLVWHFIPSSSLYWDDHEVFSFSNLSSLLFAYLLCIYID